MCTAETTMVGTSVPRRFSSRSTSQPVWSGR
jgi:hypothetical protein